MDTRTEQIQLLIGVYRTLAEGRRPFAARLAQELGLRPWQIARAADELRHKGLLTCRGLQLTFTGLTVAAAVSARSHKDAACRAA
jgi:Mn-dependent DtxR family transcriptional regulator